MPLLLPSVTPFVSIIMAGPAEARKRRKEIMQSHRVDETAENVTDEDAAATAAALAAAAASASTTDVTTAPSNVAATASAVAAAAAAAAAATTTVEKKPPKKRRVQQKEDDGSDSDSKKTQIRYDPDVPMGKEQLAAWRREARRVRNRESAAASRQRIRDRIAELEGEVDEWKGKYIDALARLEALERHLAVNGTGAAAAAATETSTA